MARLLRYLNFHRPTNLVSLCRGGTGADVALRHYSNGFPALNRVLMSSYSTNSSAGHEQLIDAKDVKNRLRKLDFFCKKGDLIRAVTCMKELSLGGVCIDLPRYSTLIDVCGEAKALVEAKVVHEHIVNYVCPLSISIFNRILNMYGKCGLMDDAYDTFKKMSERDLTSWNSMITWYARNGLGEEAIGMFTEFKEAGLEPDGQMFCALFDACGVVGDVGEGMLHFDSMSKIYGITPTMEHYASIVHMFGSACDLDGALEFIEKMPVEPNVDVWESLMNISRIQGNVELGERCAQIVEVLDPSRLTIETKNGCLPIKDSGIIKGKVRKAGLLEAMEHVYSPGDRSHPEYDKIYALLWGLKETLKELGYVPDTSSVVYDITQEDKEEAIMLHSEKLASAYALLTSSPRTYMYLMKSYHLCVDCHNVFKMLSELVGRKIVLAAIIKEVHEKAGKETIVQDKLRFHHFEDGACSCESKK